MNRPELALASVFVLYRQPDYDAFFEDPAYDGSPAQDEGEEWQLGVFSTRERAELEKSRYEAARTPVDSVVFSIDEYRLGELHWLSGFFVDEGE